MPFIPAIGVALGAAAGTGAATALGAAALATAGGAVLSGVAAIRSGARKKTALTPDTGQTQKDITVAKAKADTAAEERTRKISRRRTKTVLTDAKGLQPESSKKTLLGG